jgi:hypothetical protein
MDQPRRRHRPIFVLGIDRSGTSMLAEVLSRWGAYAGPPEWLAKPDARGPRGYWEYEPMQEFVGELASRTGISYWEPESRRLMRQQAADPELRRRALELAAEMEVPGRPWFWKEPNMIFTLPFWTSIFGDAVYVITLRNPASSALSYEKYFLPPALRDKMRLTAFFFLRWQYAMISIFEELRDHKSKLLVPYELLVASPREQCERICSFLDAEYGAASDPVRLEAMTQVVDPALWHNRSEAPFAAAAEASAAQKQLYAYLGSHLDGDTGDFDASRYPFPEHWREYLSNMGVVRWLLTNA